VCNSSRNGCLFNPRSCGGKCLTSVRQEQLLVKRFAWLLLLPPGEGRRGLVISVYSMLLLNLITRRSVSIQLSLIT
ncbi:hypothetical protein KI387_009735, partial [Taxus chinensis]